MLKEKWQRIRLIGMSINEVLILQVIFDVAIAGYILLSRYYEKKEKESLLRLVDSLRKLVEKQKQLIEMANIRIGEHQDRITTILDDIRRKNILLTELLTTIKNKTYEEDLKDRILKMNSEGKSKEEIAKELNMSAGEVELIIKLYEEV